jgi:hypothetical protein
MKITKRPLILLFFITISISGEALTRDQYSNCKLIAEMGSDKELQLRQLLIKNKYQPLVIQRDNIYSCDCLPAPRLDGYDDNARLGGADDNARLGGADDNARLGGADNNARLGGADDNARLGGADDNARLGGADDNARLGGADDNARLGGADDNARFGGSIQTLKCRPINYPPWYSFDSPADQPIEIYDFIK